jgi:hypothetical protein
VLVWLQIGLNFAFINGLATKVFTPQVPNSKTTCPVLILFGVELAPIPPSSTVAKAGRNHLNEEIIPLLPTGIGERNTQTKSII